MRTVQLNVYNLSAMSKTEAEKLFLNSEGRLCVRFYRRADGTVLTKDCPVGWQAVKRRASQFATAAFSLFAAVLSGLGLNSAFNQTSNAEVGKLIAFTKPTPTPKTTQEVTMGAIAYRPTPIPSPKRMNDAPVMGKQKIKTIQPEPLMDEITLSKNSNNKRKIQ